MLKIIKNNFKFCVDHFFIPYIPYTPLFSYKFILCQFIYNILYIIINYLTLISFKKFIKIFQYIYLKYLDSITKYKICFRYFLNYTL